MDIFYKTAQSWIGVPFRWRGYSRFGCDCAGLIIGVIKELIDDKKIFVPENIVNEYVSLKYYKHLIKQKNMQIQEIMNQYFLPCDSSFSKENIIIVKGKTKQFPVHFGIYNVTDNTFLHSTPSNGVVEVNFSNNLFYGSVDFFSLKYTRK